MNHLIKMIDPKLILFILQIVKISIKNVFDFVPHPLIYFMKNKSNNLINLMLIIDTIYCLFNFSSLIVYICNN